MQLSVAMCTYNGARHLAAQLASIAAQTRRPDELVVCDDRSTDETARLIEEFAAAAPFRVRLFVNERNLGSTKNFERAVGLCSGEIVALSDQDDVWLPGKLEMLARELDRDPAVGLVFADAELVDEGLRPMGQRLWGHIGFDERQRSLVARSRAFDLLLRRNVVTGMTAAFRSVYAPLFQPIPSGALYLHDGWIAVMIAAVAGVVALAEPGALYRQHEGQQLGVEWRSPDTFLGEDSARVLAGAGRGGWHDFGPEIKRHRAVRDRLRERGRDFDCRAALSLVEDKLAHLEARAGLPESRAARLPRVLGELLALRYHRYARGVRSAAKDLYLRAAPGGGAGKGF